MLTETSVELFLLYEQKDQTDESDVFRGSQESSLIRRRSFRSTEADSSCGGGVSSVFISGVMVNYYTLTPSLGSARSAAIM